MFSNKTRLVCSRSVYFYRRFASFLSFTLSVFRFPFFRFDFNNVKNAVKKYMFDSAESSSKTNFEKKTPPPLGRMKKRTVIPFIPFEQKI